MVTEPRSGYRNQGARGPSGVAGRIRPASIGTDGATSTGGVNSMNGTGGVNGFGGATGAGRVNGTGGVSGTGVAAAMGSPDPAAPQFATVPWGYRRCEVDAWAAWVARLLAHGRNETVRADSAEATLRATLARLDELERDRADGPDRANQVDRADAAELPRRRCRQDRTDDAAAQAPADAAARAADDAPPAAAPAPSAQAAPTEQAEQPPHAARAAQHPARKRDPRDTTPLQVVDTTLQEVMSLLHRLAGQGDQARTPER